MKNYKLIISESKIKHVQIQTIDLCNSKCVMCPYSDISHSRISMSDSLFEKIILELRNGIENNTIVKDVQIRPFLHNEPLLDSKLFERIEYIKTIIPTSIIKLNTNGFLFPQLKDKIIKSKIDVLLWSSYGNNEEDFYKITRIKKSQDEINDIYSAFKEIKNNKDRKFVVYGLGDTFEKVMYSRAGFFDRKIIYKEVFTCGDFLKRNLSFLNFFQNGAITLCCQDFLKETTMGNINNQTLKEVMSSNTWYDIKSKTLGAPSEEDFICKRCEVAEGCLVDNLQKVPLPKFF